MYQLINKFITLFEGRSGALSSFGLCRGRRLKRSRQLFFRKKVQHRENLGYTYQFAHPGKNPAGTHAVILTFDFFTSKSSPFIPSSTAPK